MCILEVNLCAVHCAVIYNRLSTHCAKLGRSALNLVAIHKVILFKKSAMYIQCTYSFDISRDINPCYKIVPYYFYSALVNILSKLEYVYIVH